MFNSDIENKEDNKLTYDDFLDDDHYVAQFLNMGDIYCPIIKDEELELEVEIMADVVPEPIQETLEPQNNEPAPKVKKSPKKRTSFHNFQKHLVITIRSVVDCSKFDRSSSTSLCERKIWKSFVNSNKINKSLVQMIFGDLTQETTEKLEEYGFLEIKESFKPEVIRKAQEKLQAELVKQLMKASLQKQLSSRRLTFKKQFVIYFQAFLEELQNGDLDRRMTKCTKLLRCKVL